jgi:hypothetical protein
MRFNAVITGDAFDDGHSRLYFWRSEKFQASLKVMQGQYKPVVHRRLKIVDNTWRKLEKKNTSIYHSLILRTCVDCHHQLEDTWTES